jgi:hypothetical protein
MRMKKTREGELLLQVLAFQCPWKAATFDGLIFLSFYDIRIHRVMKSRYEESEIRMKMKCL